LADPADFTVSENQRLKREVRQLHARVAALESSRWWRLHPRFLLARLRRRATPVAKEAAARPPAPAAQNAQVERFRAEVLNHGSFTEDWFTMHIPTWDRVLRELEGRGAKILELGSFEGLSACYALWRLPDAHVTCVDTFAGIPGYSAYGITTDIEDAFDHNVALVDAERTRKLVGETHRVLPGLVADGEQFDLVYVDASHIAVDVLVDAGLAWKLLRPGGIAIFDDYGLVPPGEDPLEHPQPAIKAFVDLVAGAAEIVDRDRQLILRKRAAP
jgi:SAM-dependent methyltransferase